MADRGGSGDGCEHAGRNGARGRPESDPEWLAANRARQRELYGIPLGERVRRLTGLLGISQARLARTLGISPAMLSQLATGRRVKIGDPTVLARLLMLDQRSRVVRGPVPPPAVDALLADVARAHWQWEPARPAHRPRGGPARPGQHPPTQHPPTQHPSTQHRGNPLDALRGIAAPARLAAAAAALGPRFPELAEALRQAAGRPA